MIESCFDVLLIAPTNDESIIKKAYHGLLHQVNPEDDMEGFQKLRTAYEEALDYARKKKNKKRKSASEQFIDCSKEIYDSFFQRIHQEKWEELFNDAVCIELETEEEIRKAFLTFLMEHFHFPDKIWKLIDRVFAITGNRKELTEWFPEDFVDFLLQSVQYEGVLNYNLFEGEPDDDFDGYIDIYQKLRQYTDMGLTEQAKQELAALKRLSVYHPYGELEEARLLIYQEQKQEAGEILERLAKEYDTEERIVCCYGQFLQMQNRWDKLKGIYDCLLAENPLSVSARTGKAEERLHEGAYREAREIILDLLELSPQDERLLSDLMDANVYLIDELKPGWESGNIEQDELMDLSWCFYQNMKFEEAIAVLNSFVPDEEHLLDYHNLRGRVYLTMDKSEEALEHLIPWLEEILKVRPDGTKKTQRKLDRLGYAYYTIGSAKASLLLKEKQKDFSEPMWYFEKAVEEEKDEGQIVSYYHTVADIWRQQKEYGKVLDACDNMLLRNQGYYPAILLRQEACLHLGMFQQVADDYQRAVYMYPYYGKPYAALMKMYFMFGEYDKVQEILRLTEERKIESDALKILQARYKAITAQSSEQLEDALLILDKLKQKGWTLQSDIEQDEWSEIEYRRGLILTDLYRLPEAKEALRKSLENDEEEVSKLFSYAAVLMQCGEYDQAIFWLKKAAELMPEDEGILYRLGWCFKLQKQYAKAMVYMKKVLALNNEHPRVRHVITELYERMARIEENNELYAQALPYMKEQIEKYPEEYYFTEMGLLYLDMDRYEEALIYFKKAYEQNPESVYAFNNAGNCYLSMNMPKQAEPFLQKAMELMGNEITPLPYNNLAKCYRMMGNYSKALSCYTKNLELFPDNADIYLLLGNFYRENQEYDKAVRTYLEGMEKTEDKKSLEFEYLRTYGIKKDKSGLQILEKKLKKKYPEDVVLFQLLGEIWLFGLEDFPIAKKYLQEAVRLSEEKENVQDIQGDRVYIQDNKEYVRGSLYMYGRCLQLMGDHKKAIQMFNRYLDVCRGADGTFRQYEEFYGEQGRRKFRLGCVWWFMGNVSEAEKYFRSMQTEKYRCDGCVKTYCYEKMMGQAMILWIRGEKKKALVLYAEAAKSVPDDMEYRFEYQQMKKWEELL